MNGRQLVKWNRKTDERKRESVSESESELGSYHIGIVAVIANNMCAGGKTPFSLSSQPASYPVAFINNRNGKMKGPSFSSCCLPFSFFAFNFSAIWCCVRAKHRHGKSFLRKERTYKPRLEYDMLHFMRMAFGINLYIWMLFVSQNERCAMCIHSIFT